uniref:Uncharacterized protein n=1 Tax=Raoultella ornithinolytica TaxID=54291 RepID=A0A7G9A6I7_RAOOR|nr:Hypothetical protein [Raoultella ornithinolytica]QUW40622.1 hypothetical protein [Raoultella ornithinolytica]UFD96500.1 hypothetical protein [Klebsiella oxytoca]UGK55301.1 Hypothetical protein [Raoultella ornithinolytica]
MNQSIYHKLTDNKEFDFSGLLHFFDVSLITALFLKLK